MAEPLVRCRPFLGTYVRVAAPCDKAIDLAFAAIARVHRLMSGHDPSSDLSRINRHAHLRAVEVDPWTAKLLSRARDWSVLSSGAFDLLFAGAAAIASGELPLHDGQPAPLATHWQALAVDGESVRLAQPACLDLGGIAKGFAIDCAIDALQAFGGRFGMVDAGGDMRGFGRPWSADLVDPMSRQPIAALDFSDMAIATSALRPDGGAAAHLPRRDPRWTSVTVRAPTAVDADALTKILVSSHPSSGDCLAAVGADAVLLDRSGTLEAFAPQRQAA